MSATPTRSSRRIPGEPERAPQDDSASRPAPADPRVAAMLALQQGAGNAAVARMLAAAQVDPVELAAAPRGVQRVTLDDITGAAGDAVSAVGESIRETAGAAAGFAIDTAGAAADLATDAAEAVGDAASAAWDALSDAAKAAWEGIQGAAAFVAKWGMGVLMTYGEWVWDLLTETGDRVWRLLEHVGSGIVGAVRWLRDGLAAAAGRGWNGLLAAAAWLGDGAAGLFAWAWDGLRRGEAWAERVLRGDLDALREGLASAFGWLGAGWDSLLAWGWEGVQAAGVWLAEGAEGVARWLLEGFLSGAAWAGRLLAKLLDLASFGEFADLVSQILKTNTRALTPGETLEAHTVFHDTIDYSQVRVDEHSLIASIGAWWRGSPSMGVTLFHTINFNQKVTATHGTAHAAWLVHELTHVWQYEHVGSQYLGEAIHAQESAAGYVYGTSGRWTDDGNGRALADRRAAGGTFADYNREQQGDITSHYYMRRTNGRDVADWEPYIEDLRAGVG